MTPSNVIERTVHDSIFSGWTELDVLQEANRCLYCYDAPCTKACPTQIDVPSFIQSIATGNIRRSATIIMNANPLGASCARVCPTEILCEGACVLNGETRPIRIGDLQRYATDEIRKKGVKPFRKTELVRKEHEVAVIGGGPAGLAAAVRLRQLGYSITIYEARQELGGLNAFGIVPFRLPKDVVQWEVDNVLDLGIDVKYGVRVPFDVTAKELLDKYDAVILAFGLGEVPRLGVEGENLNGVWDALEFIRRVKAEESIGELGTSVVVIGAGNTAIDAATCSRRLGASSVTVYYRRSESEMTAYPSEYEFARKEGVEFRWLCAPVQFLGIEGRVKEVEFVQMRLGEPDESGRPRPMAIPGSNFRVRADTVIRATGQTRQIAVIDHFGIRHHDGVIEVDGQFRTSHPRVFAVGDCIFQKGGGEAMVVEAVRQGKAAAAVVDKVLGNDFTNSGGDNNG